MSSNAIAFESEQWQAAGITGTITKTGAWLPDDVSNVVLTLSNPNTNLRAEVTLIAVDGVTITNQDGTAVDPAVCPASSFTQETVDPSVYAPGALIIGKATDASTPKTGQVTITDALRFVSGAPTGCSGKKVSARWKAEFRAVR